MPATSLGLVDEKATLMLSLCWFFIQLYITFFYFVIYVKISFIYTKIVQMYVFLDPYPICHAIIILELS